MTKNTHYSAWKRAFKRELAGSPDDFEIERLTVLTDRAAEACFWSTDATPKERLRALEFYLFGHQHHLEPTPERLGQLRASHTPT